MNPQPGWYHAEGDPPDTIRYWDGEQWVGDPLLASPTPPPAVVGHREIISKTDRFLSFLLDIALTIVTLGIGWLIWALVLVLKNEGQTPAKKLMKQQVLIEQTGLPAGPARMIFIRGIAGSIALNIALSLYVIPALILLALVIFDDQNRTFWERLSGTFVVRYSPQPPPSRNTNISAQPRSYFTEGDRAAPKQTPQPSTKAATTSGQAIAPAKKLAAKTTSGTSRTGPTISNELVFPPDGKDSTQSQALWEKRDELLGRLELSNPAVPAVRQVRKSGPGEFIVISLFDEDRDMFERLRDDLQGPIPHSVEVCLDWAELPEGGRVAVLELDYGMVGPSVTFRPVLARWLVMRVDDPKKELELNMLPVNGYDHAARLIRKQGRIILNWRFSGLEGRIEAIGVVGKHSARFTPKSQ